MPENNRNSAYEMIVTIVEKGVGEDVIDAAGAAGATGATILHGRGSGIHEKAVFFGLTIEPEKDIVLLVVPEAECVNIMEAIGKELGLDKPNSGLCFSFDVSHVIGVNTNFKKPQKHDK